MAGHGPLARGLLLGAVLLTGATSLAYEVAWTRGLVLVLGATATTTAVVLGTFVGGLGLGARWGGGLADRVRRPLLLYGALEILAALWAVAALPLAGWLATPYVAVARPAPEALRLALRVLVTAAVVLPGALLLGATLPALVRHWVRRAGEAGRGTAWVYGTNTVGAVLGCLLTGFVGVAWLGVDGWLLAAGGVASAVGLAAVAIGRGLPAASLEVVTPEPPAAGEGPQLGSPLGAAMLCGLVGIGAEIAGFRILVFFVEGFTATFAAMLGVFIAGLGLGALLLGPPLVRRARPDRVLVVLLALVALSLLGGSSIVLPRLEDAMGSIKAWAYGGAGSADAIAGGLHRTALAGAALLLFVPAFLLGPTFPLCVRWAELAGRAPGRAVGSVYLANSAGALLAPLLVGFLLVPAGGVLGAWSAVAALASIGLLAVLAAGRLAARPPALRLGVWLVVLALPVLAFARGDGRDAALVRASHVLHDRPARSLLAVETDAVTTASVVASGDGEQILYTDDFAAAATGRHYRYMRMLGHLPVLRARSPRHAMVIAFGTGTTAGAVAAHEEVERLEVVEVSDAVLSLAHHFEEANRGVLDDDRVAVIADDGRNALLLHEADLDVITLEPLMPYSPQGLPFYTRAFYELARDRLREGGVLCQWVPVHAMPAGLYAAFVQTFLEVFPDGELWFFEQSSALIGIRGGPEAGASGATLAARFDRVAADLAAAGFPDADALGLGYVASGAVVREAPVPPSPFAGRLVEDLDPFPEFHPTPRAPLNTTYLRDTLEYLATLVGPDDAPPSLAEAPAGRRLRLREATRWALLARQQEAHARFLEVASRGLPPASPQRVAATTEALESWRRSAAGYGQALRRVPGASVLTWREARADRAAARIEVLDQLVRARQAAAAGDEATAREHRRQALARAAEADARLGGDAVAAGRADAARLHALALLAVGRCTGAAEVLEAAAQALPASRDRGALERSAAWVRAHAAGEATEPAPGLLGAWLPAPPACRAEGLGPLEGDVARLLELAAGPGERRHLRLLADSLLGAARADAREEALLEALPLAGRRTPAGAAAVAGLRWRLDPSDAYLPGLLASEDARVLAEALLEIARHRGLRRRPEAARRLAAHPEDEVRLALAEAVGEDGAPALLGLLAPLLADEARAVRQAAAAALARHAPAAIEGYDFDAPREARAAAARRAAAHLAGR